MGNQKNQKDRKVLEIQKKKKQPNVFSIDRKRSNIDFESFSWLGSLKFSRRKVVSFSFQVNCDDYYLITTVSRKFPSGKFPPIKLLPGEFYPENSHLCF